MESPRMTFFEHLEELRHRAFRIFAVFLIFFVVFVTFSLRFVEVGGLSLPYLWPDFFDSISVQVLRGALTYYLPDFVEPVQIAPAEAIFVQFKVAMFLAVVFTMPVIVYQLARFVAPGLYPREKEIIARITIPATLLFLAGVLVSHFLILPFVFNFLYTVGLSIGFTTFARADPVFDLILLFFLGMGLAFQTPVIMWGLTALGILEPSFWKRHWRVAVVAFFIFGAVITPDGSGLTMTIVALPMTVLYGVGYVLAYRTWKRREGPREESEGRTSPAVWSAVILLVGALIGGALYYGTPLFVSSPNSIPTPLTSGTLNVTLPAFVFYSAQPLGPGMETGATLTATGESVLTFLWSGRTSDGTEVEIALNGTPASPFDASSDGPRMVVFPVRWVREDLDSLRLAATGGNAGVFALNLSVNYTLFDVGGRILFAYEPTPTSAAFLQMGDSSVAPPLASERTLHKHGRQISHGPNFWELPATIDDVRASNATFRHTVAEFQLGEGDVTISLARSFMWSGTESLNLWVRGNASADFFYSWYLDTRFGSLYPVLELP